MISSIILALILTKIKKVLEVYSVNSKGNCSLLVFLHAYATKLGNEPG